MEEIDDIVLGDLGMGIGDWGLGIGISHCE